MAGVEAGGRGEVAAASTANGDGWPITDTFGTIDGPRGPGWRVTVVGGEGPEVDQHGGGAVAVLGGGGCAGREPRTRSMVRAGSDEPRNAITVATSS